MHDIDLIDPPPFDLETEAEPADLPGMVDADALLALLRILDAVRDDPDSRLVVWCTDPTPGDAALDGRRAAWTPSIDRFDRSPGDEAAVVAPLHDNGDRGACPGLGAPTDRQRRQRRRSRR